MITPVSYASNIYPIVPAGNTINAVSRVNAIRPLGVNSPTVFGKVQPSECQTCKSRKYMDRSNEGNVSFQTPAHISPRHPLLWFLLMSRNMYPMLSLKEVRMGIN